jgi:hypothetical protein
MTQNPPSSAPSGRMTLSPKNNVIKMPPVSDEEVRLYRQSFGMTSGSPLRFYPRR